MGMCRKLSALAIICMLSLCGCEDMILDRYGDIETVEETLPVITKFEVLNGFNIYLKPDTLYKIIVEAPSAMLGDIVFDVNEGVLTLSDKNGFKWNPAYVTPSVTICFPVLEHISIAAPANIKTLGTIQQESLYILTTLHTGVVELDVDVDRLNIITGNSIDSGIFIISGRAANASFWMRNSASLNALSLDAGFVRMINNTKGDSYVQVNQTLRVVLNSYGNVYYTGNPTTIDIQERSSTGNLYPL